MYAALDKLACAPQRVVLGAKILCPFHSAAACAGQSRPTIFIRNPIHHPGCLVNVRRVRAVGRCPTVCGESVTVEPFRAKKCRPVLTLNDERGWLVAPSTRGLNPVAQDFVSSMECTLALAAKNKKGRLFPAAQSSSWSR